MAVKGFFWVTAAAVAFAPQLAGGQVATTTASAPEQLRPYRINPGDQLEVYVWGEDRLQRSVNVLPDGTFAFPLVGQVNAVGKLPSDIEKVISEGLKPQYRDVVPQVTVSVKDTRGFNFTITGKVRSPGTFTPGRYVNILEALTLAGGPGDFADLNSVIIVRKQGVRLTVTKLRLNDFIKGNPNARDLAGLPQMESGDMVIVP